MAVSLFLISKVACGLSFIWHRIINQSQFCDDKLSLSHLENQITETAHACDETSILLQNPIYQIAPLKDNTKVVFLLCRVVANQSSSCVQYWFVFEVTTVVVEQFIYDFVQLIVHRILRSTESNKYIYRYRSSMQLHGSIGTYT